MRRTVLLFLLLVGTIASNAQNVLDSIQLFQYPVRQGTIYKYEYDCNSTTICAPSLSIVSVNTTNDSLFHFEEGKVVGVFTLDDFHTITIRNEKDEFITYSNLQAITVKKGDMVYRGMYLGTPAPTGDEHIPGNQVDMLILRKFKKSPYKQLSYRKAIEYIKHNISAPGNPYRYTTYAGGSSR